MIIEVVGIDGSGKSTLVNSIAARTGAHARKTGAFPGKIHEQAGEVGLALGLPAEIVFRAAAITRALLMEAASARSGSTVYDRYIEGALMYFAVKHCQPIADDVLITLPRADVVLLIDVPVEVGMLRRSRAAESSLTEEFTYMKACADYLRRQAYDDDWVIVDGTQPASEVLAKALLLITE